MKWCRKAFAAASFLVIAYACRVQGGSDETWINFGPVFQVSLGTESLYSVGLELSKYGRYDSYPDELLGYIAGFNMEWGDRKKARLFLYGQFALSVSLAGASIGPTLYLSTKGMDAGVQADAWAALAALRARLLFNEALGYGGLFVKKLDCRGTGCPKGLPGWN